MTKKPLTGEELRDTKDFLVDRIAGQARELGILPNVDAHEAFVAPILRKIEVDHEHERHMAPDPAPSREGVEITEEEIGSVRWNLETDEITQESGAPLPTPREIGPNEEAMRWFLRMLRTIPAWRDEFLRAAARASAAAKEANGLMPGLRELARSAVVKQLDADNRAIVVRAIGKLGNPRALMETAKDMYAEHEKKQAEKFKKGAARE